LKRIIHFVTAALTINLLLLVSDVGAQTKVSYYKEIRPILRTRCQGCHQPANQGGKLVLTSYEAFRAGGASGASFVPGRPQDSSIMRFIGGTAPSMPKNQKPLTSIQVETITRWIAEGATNDTPDIKDPITPSNPPIYTVPPVITSLAYSNDGTMLAVSGYHETLLLSADGTKLMSRLVGQSSRIESVAFSPDGASLAVVGGAPAVFGEVQFWNLKDMSQTYAGKFGYDTLFGASYSPDGKNFACGSADNSIRVLNVADGKLTMKFDNHSDWTFSTTWATDNKHLLSTGRDQAVKLIVANSGQFVDDINTHTSAFRAMARNPVKDEVLVGGDDGIPRIYQVFRTKARTMNQEDHNLLKTFEKQSARVNAVTFSKDGLKVAVAGEAGVVNIYDSNSGKQLTSIKGIPGSTYAIAFRPSGSELAIGGMDGYVRIANVENGAIVHTFVAAPISQTARQRVQKTGNLRK